MKGGKLPEGVGNLVRGEKTRSFAAASFPERVHKQRRLGLGTMPSIRRRYVLQKRRRQYAKTRAAHHFDKRRD